MIRVMIVDDERLARETLSDLIGKHPEFQIVTQAANGDEALQKVQELEVDVIFLDVEMPGLNGLEVATRLAEQHDSPLVVFSTAYNDYAVEAFEAKAIDYILKPYEPERFRKTLVRIKNMMKSKHSSHSQLVSLIDHLAATGKLKRLVAYRRGSGIRKLVDPQDVFLQRYGDLLVCRGPGLGQVPGKVLPAGSGSCSAFFY